MSTPIVPTATAKVADGIEFAYFDSGVPTNSSDYTTVIVIHGHTYHSGAFLKLLSEGKASGLRVILVNRRLFPGSTPYTDDEIKALNTGPFDVRAAVLDKQGEYLCGFVDAMVQKYSLKQVAVVAWSLGTGFLNLIVGSITRMDKGQQTRLKEHVCALVYWDPPSNVMGLEDPPSGNWTPLYDLTMSPEARGPAFGQWLSCYFPHPDIAAQDPYKLIYKQTENLTTPSFTGIPFDQMLQMVDFSSGAKGDTTLGGGREEFTRYARIQLEKAVFDPKMREAWGNAKFWIMYGEQSPWSILWAAWSLEPLIKSAGNEKITLGFKSMKGANHFTMYDKPELVISTIKEILAE